MKKWIAVAALGLTPVVFLPVTQDFYDTNKLLVLAVSASILSLLAGVALLTKKLSLSVSVPRESIGFIALFLASLISLLFASTNKVEALMSPLGPVGIFSLIVLLLTLSNPSDELKTYLTWVFTGSTVILGLVTIYQAVGMGHVMFPAVPFLQDALWTPSGTTTTTLALFVISLVLTATLIRRTFGKPHLINSFVFSIASALVVIAALLVTVVAFFPKIPISVVPFPAALAITLEIFRQIKTAVVGAGVENFVSAYTLGKPASMIATDLWKVRFVVNADFFFHVTTIYGLTGLTAALIFVWQYVKRITNTSIYIVNLIYVLSLLLIPPTLTLLAVGALLLVLSHTGTTKPRQLPAWSRGMLGIMLILFGSVWLYATGRAYWGEYEYFMALSSAQRNEGTNTYNRLVSAIGANAFVSRYHITFSQVNLSLTNSVAAQKTLTDKDRQLMSTLVQQGISEAKVAVTLNPQNISAWENLGNTYQTLMTIASGSDQWAAASYQKALSLDPTNPVLLVNLGEVFTQEKKYDDAIRLFQRAILLKPDYANAYYNMAHVYKLKGDTITARAAFLKAMELVPQDSSDYFKAKNELDALSK